ncbi:MAG: hypothetical protein HUK04_03215 [Bacteroidaceae bacterium]|nr:hypothetical protein [Bacteroidaceae bacterium]
MQILVPMMNSLPNLNRTTGPSPQVIANLKKLARSVRSGIMAAEAATDSVTYSFRMPLDKN